MWLHITTDPFMEQHVCPRLSLACLTAEGCYCSITTKASMLCWQQGRGQATPQKHSQQSQSQGKSKKQKLAELDETPPKPWKPLNAAEVAEGQRFVTSAGCISYLWMFLLNPCSAVARNAGRIPYYIGSWM